MRDFGMIYTRYWEWCLEENIPDSAKLIGAYLLTCTHGNSLGLFRMPYEYIQADLGQGADRVSTGCKKLIESDFLTYCDRTQTVFLPSYLNFNKIQNKSHGIGTLKIAKAVSKNFAHVKTLIKTLETHKESFPDDKYAETMGLLTGYLTPSATPCVRQSIDTDTETETDTDTDTDISMSKNPQVNPLPEKPKKRKEKSAAKKFLPPTIDEVEKYFIENGYRGDVGKKAWQYYKNGNPPWHDGNGKPVKAWKQKMNGVWFKDDNKINKTEQHGKHRDPSRTTGYSGDYSADKMVL